MLLTDPRPRIWWPKDCHKQIYRDEAKKGLARFILYSHGRYILCIQLSYIRIHEHTGVLQSWHIFRDGGRWIGRYLQRLIYASIYWIVVLCSFSHLLKYLLIHKETFSSYFVRRRKDWLVWIWIEAGRPVNIARYKSFIWFLRVYYWNLNSTHKTRAVSYTHLTLPTIYSV